ncbi:metallophosphoesterase [Methyloceanibacter sp. wino2]|uniref:metallophosphoesterase family protein n=1 Tax=Methyloceanibacter sp. wino2 TaxID=2170729 RepID=UPI001FDFB820|nr:metallophosphoesterase [Methyloceanibacter sp. wino2]
MRVLHTADLHLGRQFNGISLEEDHAVVLDQIIGTIVECEVDVLVIAGDIFDRAAPRRLRRRSVSSMHSCRE